MRTWPSTPPTLHRSNIVLTRTRRSVERSTHSLDEPKLNGVLHIICRAERSLVDQLVNPRGRHNSGDDPMTFLGRLKNGTAVAMAALLIGGAALIPLPAQAAQAAQFSFNFGNGFMHNGVELQFSDGRFDNNYCLSGSEIRRELRASGFRDVRIIRNLKRTLVLAVGRKGTHWYQLVVNACDGSVEQQRIRRSANGSFSFSLTFGGNGGFGNGGGNGGGQGNGGGNHEELVCLVTFFDASQVQAGADADVASARVLPRSQAEALDGPNDRRGIFDYGTDQQTISTCDYLDNLNN